MNLRKLFGMCEHNYQIVFQYNIVRRTDFSGVQKVGTQIISRCSKCGKTKSKRHMA